MHNMVYITDDNYVLPTKVSINSIVQNITDTDICVNVICVEVSKENQNALKNLSTKNVEVKVLNYSNDFTDLGLDHHYVSKAALFKFQLPNIFKNLDAVLYVDGDTIFNSGFESVFKTDISDVYAAAVMDLYCMKLGGWHKKLGHERYFNSGLMFLNLKKMRDDNISEKLIEYKRNDKENAFMDQNALNSCFNEKVIWLSPKFNFLDIYKNDFSLSEISDFYGVPKGDLKNLFIRHLAGGWQKPWCSAMSPCADLWIPFVNSDDALKVTKNWCASLSGEFSKQLSEQNGIVQGRLSEHDGQLSEHEGRIADSNARLSQQEQTIARQEAIISEQARQIEDLRSQLDSTYNLLMNTRHRTLYGALAWLWHKVFKRR